MSLIFISFFCEEENKDQAIRGCMLTKDVVLRLAAEFAMTGGLKLKAGGQIGWWWLDTILKWTTSLLRVLDKTPCSLLINQGRTNPYTQLLNYTLNCRSHLEIDNSTQTTACHVAGSWLLGSSYFALSRDFGGWDEVPYSLTKSKGL